MAARAMYDRVFKERLYVLREEDGLDVGEALAQIFGESPKFKKAYGKRLSGPKGLSRAYAIVASMCKTQQSHEAKKVVWSFHMTSSEGFTVSKDALTDAQVKVLFQMCNVPKGVV